MQDDGGEADGGAGGYVDALEFSGLIRHVEVLNETTHVAG